MPITDFFKNNQEKFLLALGFFLVLAFGFFSGYFYSQERTEKQTLKIENSSQDCKTLFGEQSMESEVTAPNNVSESVTDKNKSEVKSAAVSNVNKGIFVGSKNSNVYHLPKCASAERIKEENKVWFQSEEEARNKGYRPSKNCFK